MATNLFLTLLAQATLGLLTVLPILFAILSVSAYLVLLAVNAVFALGFSGVLTGDTPRAVAGQFSVVAVQHNLASPVPV